MHNAVLCQYTIEYRARSLELDCTARSLSSCGIEPENLLLWLAALFQPPTCVETATRSSLADGWHHDDAFWTSLAQTEAASGRLASRCRGHKPAARRLELGGSWGRQSRRRLADKIDEAAGNSVRHKGRHELGGNQTRLSSAALLADLDPQMESDSTDWTNLGYL